MTKANIIINHYAYFHVRSDGMDGEEIKSFIQDYIEEAKKKLKNPIDVAEFVIDKMSARGDDYYEWIQIGDIDYASHKYIVNIDDKGDLKFEETTKK